MKPAFDICGMADVNPSAGFRLASVDMIPDATPEPLQTGPLQLQTPPSILSGWRYLNPRPLRPERSALPGCATPRGHAGNIALSGQSGNISRRTSRNHTRLILQSQFEVVRLVSLDVIARPSRRAGRATVLLHTPRACGQYSPVVTERKYKPPGQSQPYPPDTSIAIRSGASRLAQCDSTTFPPSRTRYRAAPHPEIGRATWRGRGRAAISAAAGVKAT